jgi:hypothetical protein
MCAQVSAKIDEAKAASEAIRSDIAVLNTRLDRIKAAREAEEAKMNEIRQAQADARSDIPALNVEKKELWEVGVPGCKLSRLSVAPCLPCCKFKMTAFSVASVPNATDAAG